eukprot:3181538-Pleurochrysis_carterae.AAC.3
MRIRGARFPSLEGSIRRKGHMKDARGGIYASLRPLRLLWSRERSRSLSRQQASSCVRCSSSSARRGS